MALKHVLALLSELEHAGKLGVVAQRVSMIDEHTPEITLTLRSSDPAVRGEFLEALGSELPDAPAATKPARKRAAKATK